MLLHNTEKLDLCVIICLCVFGCMFVGSACECRAVVEMSVSQRKSVCVPLQALCCQQMCGLVCLGGDIHRHESSHTQMTV